jgi:hypothetical protein
MTMRVVVVGLAVLVAGCSSGGSSSSSETSQVVVDSTTTTSTPASSSTTLPGSSTVTEASRPETVITGHAADVNAYESSRVLAEYTIAWHRGEDERLFTNDPGVVGVLSETGDGPGCWAVDATTLMIADHIHRRVLFRTLESDTKPSETQSSATESIVELSMRGVPVSCVVHDGKGVLLLGSLDHGTQNSDVVTVDIDTGAVTPVRHFSDSVAGRLYLDAEGSVWVSYGPFPDLAAPEVYTRIDSTTMSEATWEIRPGEPVFIQDGEVASVTIDSPDRRWTWQIVSHNGNEIGVYGDLRTVGNDIYARGGDGTSDYLWRLTDNEVATEVALSLPDRFTFAGVGAAIRVDGQGAASLVISQSSPESMSFIEYSPVAP